MRNTPLMSALCGFVLGFLVHFSKKARTISLSLSMTRRAAGSLGNAAADRGLGRAPPWCTGDKDGKKEGKLYHGTRLYQGG